ncbi:M24 family metallopeptidase [Clostridium grantii]|uniref:Xaa-Pro aminopeptidase n=1 Tax=Clostridium grantii DSM 8605 TaxID=1121316 RepID=A0A1M5SG48_9CLOT|nr:aminopeptidase P family protein [Clostridium grantii]SHH37400.1 Xaa-Pro aminopeptidase [Clostridium grantii DSM 8605]
MVQNRLNTLREKMEKKAVDGVLLWGDMNRNYITGFTGDESCAIITKDKSIFITDSRFTEQAKLEVKDFEILDHKGDFVGFIANLIKEVNLNKLYFEEDILSYSQYVKFKDALECEFLPLEGLVEEMRIIKDEDEIANITKAADIADKAFDHMLQFIQAGMKETDIALELEFFMKKQGASDLSFTSIVASGVRSSLPHGAASEKTIKESEFLTLDFGCVYNGYCSDMTRTIVIGEPTEEMINIYNTVKEAQELALVEIAPGIKCSEVDKIAREYITNKGYGKYFGHGLGHGVGREVHEAPRLSPKSEAILETGMVVTDEPGIYVPNLGGVRIEDLVLVTKDGYKVLSKSPKELICI